MSRVLRVLLRRPALPAGLSSARPYHHHACAAHRRLMSPPARSQIQQVCWSVRPCLRVPVGSRSLLQPRQVQG